MFRVSDARRAGRGDRSDTLARGRPHRSALHGWGRTAPTTAEVVGVDSYEGAAKAMAQAGPRGVLARGLGRSYGDAAQNAGGTVLDLTRLNRIRSVEPAGATTASAGAVGDPYELQPGEEVPGAIVGVDAGVSLDTLMRAMLPFGLWVPVLPGTRQVTVGGAIAADVHGKNHHTQGSFGNHVVSLDLLTPDGEIRTVAPGNDPPLFWATIGGMGLTGVVLGARIRLKPVTTAYFSVDTERAANLDELMRLMAGDNRYTYSVAWFDSVIGGPAMGRAVLTRGESARVDQLPDRLRDRPLRFSAPHLGTLPDLFGVGMLNRLTARAFNEVWFHKAPRHRRGEIQNITTFFHPLDIVSEWNRVYGPRGFCQYQFVVPFGAEPQFRRAVGTIVASGKVSCLNVLKTFGPGNAGPLSFPMPGWTLAVDIPVGPGLSELFAELDALVLDAGGRVYLAKDSRLGADAFAKMYPRLHDFQTVRDRVDPQRRMRSDLARRLDLAT